MALWMQYTMQLGVLPSSRGALPIALIMWCSICLCLTTSFPTLVYAAVVTPLITCFTAALSGTKYSTLDG